MHVSPSSCSEDQCLDFLLSAWSQRYWGATSSTTLQWPQPKADKPKSLLWWAKPLKTKLTCENKQRVASLTQSGSKAIFGGGGDGGTFGAFCFLKTEEESSSTIFWSRNQHGKKHAEPQANVRHFELARKRIAPPMHEHECMSHFVYDIGSWPSGATNLHAFAARSRLITADQIWSPAAHAGPGWGTSFLKLI